MTTSGHDEAADQPETKSDTAAGPSAIDDRDEPLDSATHPPSDAFSALGGETRLAIVARLDEDAPCPFSTLFDATDIDTSAGFAYHLRQLTDRFVRQRDDERYELTAAGRAVARELDAGTFTQSVDLDPIELDDDCPFCGRTALVASAVDNVTEIGCIDCESSILRLSFPPSGYADHDETDLPNAFDRHHRRRIESFDDSVCPDCAGSVSASIEPVADESPQSDEPADYDPAQAVYTCETCGADVRCPVALTLLDHPAVVSFYHDHGRDVRDRPIWNVGTEWRERVVSRDPWCVVVSVHLDDDALTLYVAGDSSVVDHRRNTHDDSDGPGDHAETARPEELGADTESPTSQSDDSIGGDDTGTGEVSA